MMTKKLRKSSRIGLRALLPTWKTPVKMLDHPSPCFVRSFFLVGFVLESMCSAGEIVNVRVGVNAITVSQSTIFAVTDSPWFPS
jgi:hypothetical protein